MQVLSKLIRTALTILTILVILLVTTFILTIVMPQNVLEAIKIFKDFFKIAWQRKFYSLQW